MTNLTQDAIEALRNLSEERQELAARAILDFASYDDDVYHLTDVERREVRAGLDEIRRGDVADDREVGKILKHIGV